MLACEHDPVRVAAMIAAAPPEVLALRAVSALVARFGFELRPGAAPEEVPERRAARSPETTEKPAEKAREGSTTFEVAEWCRAHAIPAEVVGRWVWVKFENKPDDSTRDALKARGFRWVKARSQWAHACGIRSRRGPGDPRERYGSVPVLGEEGGA